MKSIILTLALVTLCLNMFSQSKKSTEDPPKGMLFVPQGTFMMKAMENKDTFRVSVFVEAFWMSNEVTNREYRGYVNYVKQHPDEDMCWFDGEKEPRNTNLAVQADELRKNIKCLKYAAILHDIIDTAKLPFSDYYTNIKYDDFPVICVSQKHANFYCIWKTKMENDILKKQGRPCIHSYQLPSEAQWAYVAAQPFAENALNITKATIQPSESGAINDWGFYNLHGNVSEWTSSCPTKWGKADTSALQRDKRIMRGGSWKTDPNIDTRKVLDINSKEDYIGFRIVRAYMGKEK